MTDQSESGCCDECIEISFKKSDKNKNHKSNDKKLNKEGKSKAFDILKDHMEDVMTSSENDDDDPFDIKKDYPQEEKSKDNDIICSSDDSYTECKIIDTKSHCVNKD